jgi:hypothetical protein
MFYKFDILGTGVCVCVCVCVCVRARARNIGYPVRRIVLCLAHMHISEIARRAVCYHRKLPNHILQAMV